MKWRLGIREKFALVAILLVLVAGYALHQHLFPATSRIVVDHELVDLADEAELRCWELLNSVNQLRSVTAECANDEKRLASLLQHLNRPAGSGAAKDVPPWWDWILAVREIDATGTEQTLYGVGGVTPPGIPSHCLEITRGEADGRSAPHVSPLLATDIPLGYAQVHTVGRAPAADAPILRVPVMWGVCKNAAGTSRVLAILVALERSRSPRHLSFLVDDKGTFYQHPTLRTQAGGEFKQPFAGLDFLAEAKKLTASQRWIGEESDMQVQRGLLFKELPVTEPYYYLEGEASEPLTKAIQSADEIDRMGLTKWSEQQQIIWEAMDVRFGGASATSSVVRLLAHTPEAMSVARLRVEAAYSDRFPESSPLPVQWHERIKLQNADVQLVRFYLRLSPEERPPEAQGHDQPLYFVYAAFREELAASVSHEFREVQREGWLLGLASGVVAFLVAIFFVRPLRHITLTAQSVSQQNDGAESQQLQHQIEAVRRSLPVTRRDEVGDIARALESLLRQVLNGHERLRQLNADLEERVRERTHKLSVANEELLGLAAAKDAFLASVSHELRQPLNSIFGFLQFLEISPLDDEQQRDMGKLRAAASYLRRLIDDILDYQKIIMGGVELDPEEFDAGTFLSALREGMEPQAQEKNNRLEFVGVEGLGTIFNDRSRLQQVLTNLISNACKFSHDATVMLTARRETDATGKDWLCCDVSDTGRGMKPEEMQGLFVRFKKLSAREGNKTGTGLGLVISKGLCELMGGSITCRSEFGKGSTFSVRVPTKVAEKTSAPALLQQTLPAPAPVALMATSHALVLVIDDDANVRELMTRYLEGKGYRVITAEDGEVGLALAREQRPAVITLDVVLPGAHNGWEVLAQLKHDAATASIPVILVSFLDEPSHGLALGAADYIVKPIAWEALAASLQNVIPTTPTSGPVLVVDDDPDVRELLKRILAQKNIQTVEASNGEEALQHLRQQRPCLILLDLMMPVMDGFEFIAELNSHAEWQDIPVIVITAKSITREDQERLAVSVRVILEKNGFTQDKLLNKVLQLVHHHSPPPQP